MSMISGSGARRLCLLVLSAVLCLLTLSGLAETFVGTINADKVLFRMQANTNCGYYDRLDKGTKITLLSLSGEFFKVSHSGKTGYIMKKFVTTSSTTLKRLTASSEAQSKSKYAKVTSISGLGDPPSYVRYGDAGTDVEKLQRALQLKKAYQGVVDGKFGQMTTEALKTYQKSAGLSVTGRTDYATIKALFGRVLETTAANDPQMKGISSISQISVPNTSRKGNSGSHVKALQQALKLKGIYKAPIDSSYGDKTVQAVMAFQKRYGLAADGTAGFDTIRKLFGKNAANYSTPTEKLDWTNGGNLRIPKGAVFTVKDIYSGVTFSCKRWSGANHLDAEPVDSASTAKLKSAFGGAFSWSRRPVLIRYNGRVYAASMNGMPHGTSTISGNGFAGHFCIHFHNSRTHETNRVDPAHQNCVNRAMKATW